MATPPDLPSPASFAGFELPEWAGKAAGAVGLGGLVTGAVALIAKVMDRVVPSADRRSRERVDMRELDVRRIRELDAVNRDLAKRLEEEQLASDRYRSECFALREEKLATLERATKAELELEILRNRLEQRGEGEAPPTPPEDLAAMQGSADRHRAERDEQRRDEGHRE